MDDLKGSCIYLTGMMGSGKSTVGKLVAEADTGEFWSLFGGFAPIGRRATFEDDNPCESYAGKLYM